MKKQYVFAGRRGFTLLELIVVIFIVSLFAGIVFPSFRKLSSRQLDADTRRTASLIQYLNDSAMASKETYSADFDFQEGSISWRGPEGDRTEKIKTLAGVSLQSKGMVRTGQVMVFFSPLGIREYLEVLLRDEEKVMKVTFNPVSGRAKILTDDEQDG